MKVAFAEEIFFEARTSYWSFNLALVDYSKAGTTSINLTINNLAPTLIKTPMNINLRKDIRVFVIFVFRLKKNLYRLRFHLFKPITKSG